jgi:hypothetical protein
MLGESYGKAVLKKGRVLSGVNISVMAMLASMTIRAVGSLQL